MLSSRLTMTEVIPELYKDIPDKYEDIWNLSDYISDLYEDIRNLYLYINPDENISDLDQNISDLDDDIPDLDENISDSDEDIRNLYEFYEYDFYELISDSDEDIPDEVILDEDIHYFEEGVHTLNGFLDHTHLNNQRPLNAMENLTHVTQMLEVRSTESLRDEFFRSSMNPFNSPDMRESLTTDYRSPPYKRESLITIKITKDHIKVQLQCSICFEDFKLNEEVKQTPCKHCYHEICITHWARIQNTCPTCRQPIYYV